MSCERWRELLIDRLADELGEDEAITLEQHLAECIPCALEARRLRRLIDAHVPRDVYTPRPFAGERILGRIRAERRGGTSRAPRWWILRRPVPSFAVVALVVAAAIGGVWFGRSGRPAPGDAGILRPAPAARQAIERPGGGKDTLVVRFATTPSDAFSLAGAGPPDRF